jgi:hypothetical protein
MIDQPQAVTPAADAKLPDLDSRVLALVHDLDAQAPRLLLEPQADPAAPMDVCVIDELAHDKL